MGSAVHQVGEGWVGRVGSASAESIDEAAHAHAEGVGYSVPDVERATATGCPLRAKSAVEHGAPLGS